MGLVALATFGFAFGLICFWRTGWVGGVVWLGWYVVVGLVVLLFGFYCWVFKVVWFIVLIVLII